MAYEGWVLLPAKLEARADNGRWLAEAAKLRRAPPARSAAQIVDIIARAHGVWLLERTVRQHLYRLGLSRQALSGEPARVFGRFQASRPNEIWLNSYIRQSFVAEMEERGIASFEELNDLFMSWAEEVANARVHAETKQAPLASFLEGFRPVFPSPEKTAEAFRWSVTRSVTKTAVVSLAGNRYQVGAELVGKAVELRFHPEDLSKSRCTWEANRPGRPCPS